MTDAKPQQDPIAENSAKGAGKGRRPYSAPEVKPGRPVEVATLGGGGSGLSPRMLSPRGVR